MCTGKAGGVTQPDEVQCREFICTNLVLESHGLGDDLATALAAREFRVRAYCPVGDLVAGMAYLVRRLLENTSNDSFLSAQASGVPIDELLAAP